ncbi:MAG TPA: alpha/beta hydrolase fold domain-containing protein [Stellaceae bacterium]|nr:alpha/beta hydrolase fold domain-containing protein [Stellaceae bacterium]
MPEVAPAKSAPTLSRRHVMGVATALLAGSCGPALAQEAAAKGSLVWDNMDQKALDDAYDQSVYAPNYKLVNARRRVASLKALEILGQPRRIPYGPTPAETLDIYRTKAANPPIMMFVHGGAWKASDAKKDAFLAEVFVKGGAMVVMPNMIGVVEAKGDLMTLADQLRRAVAHVIRHGRDLGGDPGRLYLIGHSSGGHLGGVLVTTDWQAQGLPARPFKAALLGSGMYDLKPVRLSKRSKYVAFTDEIEQRLSPQRHIDRLMTPLILTHGDQETPEFQRQTNDFHRAVQAAGKPAQLLIGVALNHYETQETLGNPYGFMGRPALAMMNLTP